METCGACAHFARCQWLIQAQPDDAECAWIPSRFVAKIDTNDASAGVLLSASEHHGDPCVYCGIPHDEVAVGDCPGRVMVVDTDEARRLSDENVRLLFRELHDIGDWRKASKSQIRRAVEVTRRLLQCGYTAVEIKTELRRLDSAANDA